MSYEFISQEVRQLTVDAIELMDSLGLSLGRCMGKVSNGNCTWFVLTCDSSLTSLFVLVVTPYGYMSEWRFKGQQRQYGLITSLEDLASWLLLNNLRALSAEEFDEFTGGSSE